MAPNKTSSMLGWLAAVTETESPSQLRPAVIQRMWISFTAGARWVDLPYGASAGMDTSFPIQCVCSSLGAPEHSVNKPECDWIPFLADARQLFFEWQVD